MQNGITASWLNLAQALARSQLDVTLVVDAEAIERFPERQELLSRVPSSINVIARVGVMSTLPEERYAVSCTAQAHEFWSPALRSAFEAAHRREFRRMFGDVEFDVAVNFEGYQVFWAALMAHATAARRCIFLHNDMFQEWQKKFPYLRMTFDLYGYYDAILSVSNTMMEENSRKLEPVFERTRGKFLYSENVINSELIESHAAQPLDRDLAEWLEGGKTFLSIGRLSLEKDQAKLLRAFHALRSEYPDSRLVLVGSGPLEEQLRRLVQELSLGTAVKFAGARSNPFPILAACGCFVLSSNHEGQPMTLLEALTLRKPIVATDIPGNRDVLSGRGGLLVENTIEGLVAGMGAFLRGDVLPPQFDAEKYASEALSSFLSAVGFSPDAGPTLRLPDEALIDA